MMQEWSCDWRVVFAAVRLAAAGLYLHPDLMQVEVADVPVRQMVDDVQTLLSKRGYALERFDAAESSVFEDWGMAEQPRQELLMAGPTSTSYVGAYYRNSSKSPSAAIHCCQNKLSISLRIENDY
jgi:hypothetical protein